MKTIRVLAIPAFIAFILLSLLTSAAGKDDRTAETSRLIVRARAGVLSQERFEELANKAEKTLLNILRIWSTKARIERFGKITLEFHHPPRKARFSVFSWSRENGRRVRTVRVFGVDKQPEEFAHKLTHAVFPNRDKLIRNMMGIFSENRLGTLDSFPMCGFSTDAWVQVLLQLDSSIPLASLGPDHDDWGMEFKNKTPVVRDRARQHAAYAESGSFGEYLIETHGINSMKNFNRLARTKERLWEEAFGLPLAELERGWIRHLKSRLQADAKDVSILKPLREENPVTACYEARRLASDR
jgi:hypothetical protein